MIPRYSREKMTSIWSDSFKWKIWLQIETLACKAQSLEGKIPPKALKEIQKKAKIIPERIEAIEKETRHDVIAFVSAVAETIGEAGRYLHLGLTSSDVLDTALACQFVRASDLLLDGIQELLQVLRGLALKYKETPMMGRTHGIHAEPITFGLKVATWFAEMERQKMRLLEAKKTIKVGKISGAVGTYVHLSPKIENYILTQLSLEKESPATQVVSRDRHAFYFSVLAGIASSIEKIAVEIRHLSRTEVGEVAEPFGKKQKGSSAMPHKKNPILAENLTGLARLIRSYAAASLENIALWHERDISHSSVERVIAPDSTILLDFMIHRLIEILKGLEVYPEKMKKNLEATRGVVFSQEILLALVQKGLTREEAYQIVQRHALACLQNGEDFQNRLVKDPIVKKYLKPSQVGSIFNWAHKLTEVVPIIQGILEKRGTHAKT